MKILTKRHDKDVEFHLTRLCLKLQRLSQEGRLEGMF